VVVNVIVDDWCHRQELFLVLKASKCPDKMLGFVSPPVKHDADPLGSHRSDISLQLSRHLLHVDAQGLPVDWDHDDFLGSERFVHEREWEALHDDPLDPAEGIHSMDARRRTIGERDK
jgi:hypothetical protein